MRKSYHRRFIRTCIFILTITLIPFTANASKLKLYKDVKVETLRLWLNTEGIADQQLADEIQTVFEYAINDFNKSEEATFKVVKDTTNTNGRIIFSMGAINYVNTGRSLSTTALDATLIAGHILLIANYGFTIPVWPFFMPKTSSLVEIDLDYETFRASSQSEIMIGKNGYFAGLQKQNKNFKKKVKKVITKQLKNINKQNRKNKKFEYESK